MIIVYTDIGNIDSHGEVIDKNLLNTKEILEPDIVDSIGSLNKVVSKWDLNEWNEIQLRNKEVKAKMVEKAVQDLLDSKAKSKGYDSIISACSYATSKGTFGAEGQSFVDWRDAVWTKVFTIQSEVTTGTIKEPTLEELIFNLPKFEDFKVITI